MDGTHTLVIGAGPAGLAMAGRLGMAGHSFRVIEKSDRLADAWHRHYHRLHLHTTKRYSALPGLPFGKEYPRFVPRLRFLDYCHAYAEHFQIRPEFRCAARHITRGDGGWITTVDDRAAILSRHVVVATGLNHVPHSPDWPGFADFAGEWIHSHDYREPGPYRGKTVLVVGMGNTGAEIALDLAEGGARPTLAVRGAVNIVRRTVLGLASTDTSVLLARSGLPDSLVDAIANGFQKITVGDLSRYGLPRRADAPTRQQRRSGTTPVIDIGTVAAIKRGDIAVRPGIARFEGGEVHFVDDSRQRFDAVILATGYRTALGDLLEGMEAVLDANGAPLGLWSADYPGLYFLGFNACVSGQLFCIGEDSQAILGHLERDVSGL